MPTGVLFKSSARPLPPSHDTDPSLATPVSQDGFFFLKDDNTKRRQYTEVHTYTANSPARTQCCRECLVLPFCYRRWIAPFYLWFFVRGGGVGMDIGQSPWENIGFIGSTIDIEATDINYIKSQIL